MTLSEDDKEYSISIITYYTQNASCKGLTQQKQIFDDFFDLICSPDFFKLSEKAQFSAVTCIKGLLTNYDSVTLGVSNNDRLEAICCLAGLQPDNKNPDNLLTREALKCLANILLVAQEFRSVFHKLSSASLILERLSKAEGSYSTDALFLYSRILFLSTAEPSAFLIETVLNHDFDRVVLEVLTKLKNQPSAQGKNDYSIEMYFTEVLKVVFSLLVNFSKSFVLQDTEPFFDGDPSDFVLEKFRSLFFPLLHLVSLEKNPVPDQIFVNTLPILVNFTTEDFLNIDLSPDMSMLFFCERLLNGVLAVVKANKFCMDTESDYERIIPHVVLLKLVSCGSQVIKKIVSDALLPSKSDRLRPIGEGDSPTARLAAVLKATSFSLFKGALCELFYTLCDEDADNMSKTFGYGNVAGFLVSKSVSSQTSDSTSSHDTKGSGEDINPITGQFRSAELCIKPEPMSEEEELREAERLFVLFERMKRNPAIQISNPVEEAFHAGKFADLKIEEESD